MAVSAWMGVLLAEAVAWRVTTGASPVGSILFTIPAGLVAVALVSRSRSAVSVLLAGLLAGSMCGSLYWQRWRSDVAVLREKQSTVSQVAFTADARSDRFGIRTRGVARTRGMAVRVEVGIDEDSPVPEIGQTARVHGTLRPAGRDESGRRMHRKGEVGRISARLVRDVTWSDGFAGVIGSVRATAVGRIARIAGDGGALVAGVGLGDRRRLAGTPLDADFRTTGLSHLIAVSGSHLSVVAVLLTTALRRVRVPRGVTAVVVLCAAGAYVLLTGAAPSAIRSWLMCGVVAAAGVSQRRTDGLSGLALAVICALVVSPPVAFDLGFQLSVAAVGGLLLFARLTDRWIEAGSPALLRPLSGPIALTLVAQAATLPVALPAFGVVSLVAPLANVVCGPLVAVILVLTVVGLLTGVVVPPLGDVLLSGAGVVGTVVSACARLLAAMPGAAVPLGAEAVTVALLCGGSAFALWAWWPRPHAASARIAGAASVLVLLIVLAGPRSPDGAFVTAFDVGQGDAILVRDGPDALLVDTGPSASALREALTRARVRTLDRVVLTHAHDDHTGGTGALTGVFAVRDLMVPASDEPGAFGRQAAEARVAARGVSEGTDFVVGRVSVRVLWPREPVEDPGENSSSVVLLVEHDGMRVLLTGDAEAEVLERLAASGALPDVDVLKVGHHGSRGAVTEELLDVLRPEIAVISVGSGNRFGHPTAETIALLQSAGCRIIRTDESGDVDIALGGRLTAARRGSAGAAYATLEPPEHHHEERALVREDRRPEARLSHPERAVDAGGTGAHATAQARGRGREPGLQLRSARCRVGRRGRDRRGREHSAVRERAPPGDRAQHREDGQGRA